MPILISRDKVNNEIHSFLSSEIKIYFQDFKKKIIINLLFFFKKKEGYFIL